VCSATPGCSTRLATALRDRRTWGRSKQTGAGGKTQGAQRSNQGRQSKERWGTGRGASTYLWDTYSCAETHAGGEALLRDGNAGLHGTLRQAFAARRALLPPAILLRAQVLWGTNKGMREIGFDCGQEAACLQCGVVRVRRQDDAVLLIDSDGNLKRQAAGAAIARGPHHAVKHESLSAGSGRRAVRKACYLR